jgi:hypothetical protein
MKIDLWLIDFFFVPFNTQQTNLIPRNSDKPHESSGIIELFNTIVLFEQSSDANCCHLSARKHPPGRVILLIVQSIVGTDNSSRWELICKQRNGWTASSDKLSVLQRGILSSFDGSNSHQFLKLNTVSSRIILPILSDG